MKEKIEEISLSMERGHRRVLRVLGALLAVGPVSYTHLTLPTN